MNHLRVTVCRVLITATIGFQGPALAQVDTSEWKCELCPFETGYRADYDVGADYVSDSDARFGNASGYDESGGYLNVSGDGRYVADDFRLTWIAEDLGLDSRVLEVEGGSPGQFGFHLGYSELPHRLFDSTQTVYSTESTNALILPGDWAPSSFTSGFATLASSLRPVDIASDRRSLAAGARFWPSSGISTFVDYRRREREGVDIVAGSTFLQGSLLPRSFDFDTDLIDAGVEYSSDSLSLKLGWFGSFFDNNASGLTWDNPFIAFTGAEQGRISQEPDNEFQQISLSGAYVADSIRSVIAFSAATGRGKQTDELLPYTINPTIAAGSLPVSSLDGKIDTSNYALTITSRPIPKARLKFSYRYDERDNNTPRSSWMRVVVDSFQSPESELNTPYSFERGHLSVSGSYRPLDNVRLSAGYDRSELERSFQEVADQTEDSGWGRARLRLADWLEVTAKGGTARREIDRYDTSVGVSFGQNPLLRKYNLAHRYREFGQINLSITPASLPLSFSLTGQFADDSYSKSRLGLTDSRNEQFSADASISLTDSATLYLTAGLDDIDTIQLGSASFSNPTWQAFHRDRFRYVGGGLQLSQLGENATLRLDYLDSNGDTSINVREMGVDNLLPNIRSDLESLRLTLTHRRSERLNVDISFRYEQFTANDWAIEGVEPDTIPAVLTLGADPYDYSVWIFGLSFRYLIGERGISFPE